MKRWMMCLSAVIVMAGMFFLCGVAFATGDVTVKEDKTIFQESGGTAQVPLRIENTTADKQVLSHVRVESNSYLAEVSIPAGTSIAANSTEWIIATVTVNEDQNVGHMPLTLQLYFKDRETPVSANITINKNSAPPVSETQKPSGGEQLTALVLDPTGLDGQPVPAPSGNAGDWVKVRLPIRCRAYYVMGTRITPQLSANLDEFPFEITAVDYTRSIPDLAQGGKAELVYEFRLSEKVTSGLKPVKFNAVYYDPEGKAATTQFVVYVNVIEGAEPETQEDPDTPEFVSTPKLMVESYSTDPDRLIAGEPFNLKLVLKNTSDLEAVENIQVSLTADASGAILPGENGSNSLYIKKIDKGESVEQIIPLQSAPAAEAKAHLLTVTFGYEGAKSEKAYETTETITLPVQQKIRVKIDEPVLYAEGATVEQSVGVYFALYNMGKAALYNCMVDVEGEGLKMEESFFGGNIASGATMRADFNIIPSVAGDIAGKIVITYEDVYGVQMREEKPFNLYVEEAFVYEPSDMEVFDDGFMMVEPEPQGLGVWLYIIIGAAVLIVVVAVLLIVRSKRRKKRLEDV